MKTMSEKANQIYMDYQAMLQKAGRLEELAEELCVKKSTISMYENDKVDIKGSILIELSGVLHTSPNYLLGMEEYEEDLLEIITVY